MTGSGAGGTVTVNGVWTGTETRGTGAGLGVASGETGAGSLHQGLLTRQRSVWPHSGL